jgi:hypothetical protein
VGTNYGLGSEYSLQNLMQMFSGNIGGGGGGSNAGVNIDSVDKLGGANSEFFKNMMAQFSPAFAQRRAEGLAAAKEASGNLTGSGYANAMGGAINRSLGEEQERLANVGMQGIGMELDRQKTLADITGRQNAATAGADASIRGSLMNFILGRAGLDMDAQKLGLQAGMANQDAGLRAGLANQSTRQGSMDLQSKMDFDRLMAQYNARNNMNNSNSDRYTQMLNSMTTTGVGPNQVTKSGGVMDMMSGLFNMGGQFLGSGMFKRPQAGVPQTSNTPWSPFPKG